MTAVSRSWHLRGMVLLATLLGLAAIAANAHAFSNLLSNPGFEDPLTNNWGSWGTSTMRTDHHPFSGTFCLQLCGSNTQGGIYQTVGVTPGTHYEASFYFQWDKDWSAGQREFEIEWKRDDKTSITTQTFIVGFAGNPSIWHYSGQYPLVAPVDATRAEIRFDYNWVTPSNAFIYLDDVVFEEVNTSADSFSNGDPGKSRSYYRAQGTNILDPEGRPFIPRGLSLSGWFFPEAYMFGIQKDYSKWKYLNTYTEMRNRFEVLLGSEAEGNAFWDTYRSNFMTEADVAMFRNEFGINMVRFPFNYRDLSPENNPGAYNKKGFADMDKVLRWCAENNIAVILDMHSCPGGASSEPSGDPEFICDVWNSTDNRWEEHAIAGLWETNTWGYMYKTGRTPESNAQRTADLWKYIADRYKNEENIVGYELINEPFLPNKQWSWQVGEDPTQQMRQTFIKVTEAVREVDPHHIVFVSGDWFSESIGGMVPPWDTNMGIAVHRYWKETGFQDGAMQSYLDARNQYQLPFWLSESGENSDPWFYAMARLFESNNIGWSWWAWKKTQSIAAGFGAHVPESFKYVINNLWYDTIDTNLFRQGLYEMADAFRTTNCEKHVGYFASLFNTNGMYNVASQPFEDHHAPGTVLFADYDIGNQGVAYNDTAYWNTNFAAPVAYNQGWMYRNDGVDIGWNNESKGYMVNRTDAGEWLKYTIHFEEDGPFNIGIRYATAMMNRQIQFHLDDATDLTGVITLPKTGGWTTWQTYVASNVVVPAVGTHTVKVSIVAGGLDLTSMTFEKTPPPPEQPPSTNAEANGTSP